MNLTSLTAVLIIVNVMTINNYHSIYISYALITNYSGVASSLIVEDNIHMFVFCTIIPFEVYCFFFMVCEQEYVKFANPPPPPNTINDIGSVIDELAFIHSTQVLNKLSVFCEPLFRFKGGNG